MPRTVVSTLTDMRRPTGAAIGSRRGTRAISLDDTRLVSCGSPTTMNSAPACFAGSSLPHASLAKIMSLMAMPSAYWRRAG